MKALRDEYPERLNYHGEAMVEGALNAKEYMLSWESPPPRRSLFVTVDIEGGRLSWGWIDPSGRLLDGGTTDPDSFDLEPLLLDLADQEAWAFGRRPRRR
ncbi:MAG TPA: hypothetical protein VJB57_08825 [Dehalococcoidia bacterium]|nr:hypothetical protein [Dehalococcoidia bacterium]